MEMAPLFRDHFRAIEGVGKPALGSSLLVTALSLPSLSGRETERPLGIPFIVPYNRTVNPQGLVNG